MLEYFERVNQIHWRLQEEEFSRFLYRFPFVSRKLCFLWSGLLWF